MKEEQKKEKFSGFSALSKLSIIFTLLAVFINPFSAFSITSMVLSLVSSDKVGEGHPKEKSRMYVIAVVSGLLTLYFWVNYIVTYY